MVDLARVLGFLFARMPEWLVWVFSVFVADLFWMAARGRRRIVLSNLRLAFPEKEDEWVVRMGRASVRQTIEFGILAIALPFFGERRLRRIFSVSEEAERVIRERKEDGRPAVLLGPHLGPQEGHALLPFFFPDIPSLGGIYRPLENEKVDRWIRETRERFGARMFSRKRGLQEAIRLLRNDGWLGIFFDQNATGNGALITFFDRVASVTELPEILAKRHEAKVMYFYTARSRFWRIEIRGESGVEEEREKLTIRSHLWLENLLRSDERLVPNWLWLHNRWRHQKPPRFSLREKRNLLEEQNRYLGRERIPRKEPFFVHFPEDLSRFVLLVPFIRALRESRPDIAVTAIGRAGFLRMLEEWGLCEEAVCLPESGEREQVLRRLRRRYPAVHLDFAGTGRAARDLRKIGALHRYGIGGEGETGRHLTKVWRPPAELEGGETRFELWEGFFRHHRLSGEIDLKPFGNAGATNGRVGIVWDLETGGESRGAEKVRNLVSGISEKFAGKEVVVLVVGEEGANLLEEEGIETVLVNEPDRLREELLKCEAVAGPLCGAIYLANAVGVPVVFPVLEGKCDRPVFEAPCVEVAGDFGAEVLSALESLGVSAG